MVNAQLGTQSIRRFYRYIHQFMDEWMSPIVYVTAEGKKGSFRSLSRVVPVDWGFNDLFFSINKQTKQKKFSYGSKKIYYWSADLHFRGTFHQYRIVSYTENCIHHFLHAPIRSEVPRRKCVFISGAKESKQKKEYYFNCSQPIIILALRHITFFLLNFRRSKCSASDSQPWV